MDLTVERYLSPRLLEDLADKMVLLTGPRQVGKTTLSRALAAQFTGAVYLNYDVLPQRAVLLAQSWRSEDTRLNSSHALTSRMPSSA